MTVAEAKALQEALRVAIENAESTGSDVVQLRETLSADLGNALDSLEFAINQARRAR